MNSFWDQQILNNSLKDWAVAIGIIIVAITALRLFRFVVIRKLKAWSQKTKATLDDFIIRVLQTSGMPLLYVLAVYFGLKYIEMPVKVADILHIALLVVTTFYIIRIITAFVTYLLLAAVSAGEQDQQRRKQVKGIMLIVQVILWLAGVLFLIDNLGYNITTVVAGLGIGGIAIALAAQTILGDLFSYLVIFFDKPFEIGDFIIIQDKMGTVEHVGLKTTRLKALSGEQLICSNTDLTNSRIHNYKRMQERRVLFSFGLIYSTSVEKLRTIPQKVKRIIETAGNTRFDRAHFVSFGDSSLNFEIVYHILSADYNIYMDKQQAINLDIVEYFENAGIEFAFPTQTLYFNHSLKEQV